LKAILNGLNGDIPGPKSYPPWLLSPSKMLKAIIYGFKHLVEPIKAIIDGLCRVCETLEATQNGFYRVRKTHEAKWDGF
jgi:hypothetical protein